MSGFAEPPTDFEKNYRYRYSSIFRSFVCIFNLIDKNKFLFTGFLMLY